MGEDGRNSFQKWALLGVGLIEFSECFQRRGSTVSPELLLGDFQRRRPPSVPKHVKVKVAQSCPTLCDPNGLYTPRNSLGQNIGVGSISLLQGIFPTQGLNPGLPHCRQTLYQLSHKGSPRILGWVAYPFSSRSSRPRNWTGISCIAGAFFTNWAVKEAYEIHFLQSPLLVAAKITRVNGSTVSEEIFNK